MKGNWDFDTLSGHIAHSSGLYAYVDMYSQPDHGIRCLGPFSSYSSGLTEAQFYSYCANAICKIEERLGGFTLWGACSRVPPDGVAEVEVLGETMGFLPNLCMRSCILIRGCYENLVCEQLQKEWTVGLNPASIEHRLGFSFEFRKLDHKQTIARCLVRRQPNLDFDSNLSDYDDLTLTSLSTTAACVLARLTDRPPIQNGPAHVEIELESF